MISRNNNKYKEGILIVITITIILIFSLRDKRKDDEIKRHYIKAIGKIEKYYSKSVDLPRKITYTFKVKSTKYSRDIIVNYKFDICENFNNCKDKRYWVIYSPENPENSLINLEVEIQGIENPEFPKNLDDFK